MTMVATTLDLSAGPAILPLNVPEAGPCSAPEQGSGRSPEESHFEEVFDRRLDRRGCLTPGGYLAKGRLDPRSSGLVRPHFDPKNEIQPHAK
jgi:hypothetical protein